MTKKQVFWLGITLGVIGIVFLIWGGHVYNNYPNMEEAKSVMRAASKAAWLQYLISFSCLIGGYILLRINGKI